VGKIVRAAQVQVPLSQLPRLAVTPRTNPQPTRSMSIFMNCCQFAVLTITRLTREEREELYKLARERIFGSSEENIAGM
jgi:hypothetical protein